MGGRPISGPMQTVGGNRGARLYSADAIDNDFKFLSDTIGSQTSASLLPSRNDTGMFINLASFNIRDQIRENDPTPLQFKYAAADCRMYYTLANVHNMSRLWRDVARAAWIDWPSLCVHNSTGFSTPPNTNISLVKPPPDPTAQSPDLNIEHANVVLINPNSTEELLAAPSAIPTGVLSRRDHPSNFLGNYQACVPPGLVPPGLVPTKLPACLGNLRCVAFTDSCAIVQPIVGPRFDPLPGPTLFACLPECTKGTQMDFCPYSGSNLARCVPNRPAAAKNSVFTTGKPKMPAVSLRPLRGNCWPSNFGGSCPARPPSQLVPVPNPPVLKPPVPNPPTFNPPAFNPLKKGPPVSGYIIAGLGGI